MSWRPFWKTKWPPNWRKFSLFCGEFFSVTNKHILTNEVSAESVKQILCNDRELFSNFLKKMDFFLNFQIFFNFWKKNWRLDPLNSSFLKNIWKKLSVIAQNIFLWIYWCIKLNCRLSIFSGTCSANFSVCEKWLSEQMNHKDTHLAQSRVIIWEQKPQ